MRGRQEASHDAEVEYRAVFEAAPDGIVLVGADGAIVDVNPCALRMFGYERVEVVGQAVEMLVPRELQRSHVDHRHRYMGAPRARPMGVGVELRGLRKNGSEFPVEISLSPVTEAGEGYVISIVRDLTERRALQAFGAGAVRAAEEERQRIARELHDDTAQRLAGLMLMLKAASRTEDAKEREARIEQVREEIGAAADAVRRIARGLRPPILDEFGLPAALESLVRTLRHAHGLDIDLSMERPVGRLHPDSELAMYRIVQEALSNAIRHSGASRVAVALHEEDHVLRAEVRDDGRGFATERPFSDDGQGLGLVGMRERARNAGGTLEIDGAPGAGTRVRVTLPRKGSRP
ncbi:MAG TPA: PAS domain S-box protein [Gemmatimonadota bacterium]|nr:PAS domain S-box protein [Gemmatimonadota bacterium]